MPVFDKILVVGLGLIGGSLALAIKKRNLAREITGVDCREENLKAALDEGAIHRSLELPMEIAGTEIVILATPVGAAGEILELIAPYLSPGTIVTDVASTKDQIVSRAAEILPAGVYFVGGHPMAGSEQNGFRSASADLFKNAYYFLTPVKDTSSTAINKLLSLVKGIGAIPLQLSPQEHDRIVAAISHLPHLAAAALVNTLGTRPDFAGIAPLAAGGFKDTTRIASGVPEMWQEILLSNRKELIPVLENFITVLEEYKQSLQRNDSKTLLSRLKAAREARCSLH